VALRRDSARIYAAVEAEHNNRAKQLLCSGLSPHKWWSVLKSAVFGSSSTLPPLLDVGGFLVCSSEGKANLLNGHFDSKQCRLDLPLPPTCHPEVKLSTFAFRSGELCRLLLDLDAYGGVDPHGFFPFFSRKWPAYWLQSWL